MVLLTIFTKVFAAHPYAPLPTNTLNQKNGRRQILALTSLVLIVVVGLVYSVMVFMTPYNPLDNYQNINPLPLVHDGYSGPPPPDKRAVVSSLYSDSYTMSVAVLGHSIHHANVSAHLILPYLEDRVSAQALCITRAVGWQPHPVPFIPPPHNGKGIHRRFSDQYTKLNIWALDKLGIERAVYLDADTLILRNFDELFDSPFEFAAVPDVYRPNDSKGFTIAFNAGVLAFRPSSDVLTSMMDALEVARYPLKEAEQAFLNVFFASTAVRLPYAYNANLAIKTRTLEMWEGLKEEIRIVHYTLNKPFTDTLEGADHILTPDEQRKVTDRAKRRNGGLYSEEVGWWRRAFEEMMRDKGGAIEACYD